MSDRSPSHRELALLSAAVYTQNGSVGLPDGWALEGCAAPAATWGFCVATYVHVRNRWLVIAFRGTCENIHWLGNIGLAAGHMPPQQGFANSFVRRQIVRASSRSRLHDPDDDHRKEVSTDPPRTSSGDSDSKVEEPSRAPVTTEILLGGRYGDFCATMSGQAARMVDVKQTSEIMQQTRSLVLSKEADTSSVIDSGRATLTQLAAVAMKEQMAELSHLIAGLGDEYSITLTGHSLGGTMAELCSIKFGLPAVTFDSAGVPLPDDTSARTPGSNKLIHSYLSAPNVVNSLHPHVGTVYRVWIPYTCGRVAAGHVWWSVVASASRLGMAVGAVAAPPAAAAAAVAAAGTGTWSAMRVFGLAPNGDEFRRQHSIDEIAAHLHTAQQVSVWPKQDDLIRTVWRISALSVVPLPATAPGIRQMFRQEAMIEAQMQLIGATYTKRA